MKIILPPNLQRKKTASSVLFFMFLIFSVTVLFTENQGGASSDNAASQYRRGIDTVFALDVSRSMDLQDVQPGLSVSRLERGISIAKQTASSQASGRTAASIGRGRGYLSVPLTYDSEAVLNFLNSLDNQALMGGRSTNLQSLIEASASAFQTSSPARRVIVLISDGESHFGSVKNALNYCIREGIIIYAVAVGSDEGAVVTFAENTETENDAPPVSKRDVQSMRMAAERTGGIYIDGNREDAGSILISQLLNLSRGAISTDSNTHVPADNIRRYIIILAVISYAAHKFVLRSRNKKPKQDRRKSNRSLLISLLIVHCSLLIACTEGKLLLLEANYLFSRARYDEAAASYYKALEHKDAAPYADYGLGTAFMAMDEGNTALQRFNDSKDKLAGLLDSTPKGQSEHRELLYRLHYNSGIIFFEEGDYDSAAASFKEALKTDSSRAEAKRNLEISLMSIQRETSQERHNEEGYEETKDMMFQMVRQQEEQFWQSGEWTEERFSGPDY